MTSKMSWERCVRGDADASQRAALHSLYDSRESPRSRALPAARLDVPGREGLGTLIEKRSGTGFQRDRRVRPGDGSACRTRLREPISSSFLRVLSGPWRYGRGSTLTALLGVVVLLGALAPAAHAERVPKEGPQDPRIRTVVYNPRDVVKIEATYGYHTVVEFADDEVIQALVIGDSVAWEAERSAAGNRIFLKPKEDRAATNLTVVTDRRTYSFALEASRSKATTRMTWRLRFSYPDEEAERRLILAERASLREASLVRPDAPRSPDEWNLDYSYAGSERLRPVQMFDDGEFTYLRFAERRTLPAVFVVDEEKNESLVNARMSGEYLVVHRVAKQFALRTGSTLTCIFNEGFETGKGRPLNAPRKADEITASRDAEL